MRIRRVKDEMEGGTVGGRDKRHRGPASKKVGMNPRKKKAVRHLVQRPSPRKFQLRRSLNELLLRSCFRCNRGKPSKVDLA